MLTTTALWCFNQSPLKNPLFLFSLRRPQLPIRDFLFVGRIQSGLVAYRIMMWTENKSVVYTTAREAEVSTKGGTAQDRKDMWRVGRQQELNVRDIKQCLMLAKHE